MVHTIIKVPTIRLRYGWLSPKVFWDIELKRYIRIAKSVPVGQCTRSDNQED